jgi:hypothetical protein
VIGIFAPVNIKLDLKNLHEAIQQTVKNFERAGLVVINCGNVALIA